MRNLPPALRPTALQARVLVAALSDRPDVARRAWRDALVETSLDELGNVAFELLPLVSRNVNLPEADPGLPRLKGVHRRTWVKNNLLVGRTKGTAAALADAGIRPLFVEGVVLAARFYPEVGLRPTSVVDLLVDARDHDAAAAALGRAGWRQPPGTRPRRDGVEYFFDVDRNTCALWTTPASDAIARGRGSAPLGAATEHHPLDGVDVTVPTATETLFVVVVRHARLAAPGNVQWIVDAKLIVAAGVDWQRLIMLGDAYGQLPRIRDALELLARLPGASAPAEVRAELDRRRGDGRARLAYVCTNGTLTGPGRLPALVADHVAETADRSVLGAIATFPRFLRRRWGLARGRDVPRAVGARALRYLRGRRSAA